MYILKIIYGEIVMLSVVLLLIRIKLLGEANPNSVCMSPKDIGPEGCRAILFIFIFNYQEPEAPPPPESRRRSHQMMNQSLNLMTKMNCCLIH